MSSAINRRHMLMGGLLTVGAGMGFWRQPVAARPLWTQKPLAQLAPNRFAGWTGSTEEAEMVLPSSDEREGSPYDAQLARVYRRPGAHDVLMVVAVTQRQSGSLRVHQPEVCYPAAGYRITAMREVMLDLERRVAARFLTAECEGRIEQILYWIRIGAEFATSASRAQWLIMQGALEGTVPDGMLARFSVVGADPDMALTQLMQFTTELVGAAGPAGRSLLVMG